MPRPGPDIEVVHRRRSSVLASTRIRMRFVVKIPSADNFGRCTRLRSQSVESLTPPSLSLLQPRCSLISNESRARCANDFSLVNNARAGSHFAIDKHSQECVGNFAALAPQQPVPDSISRSNDEYANSLIDA